MPCLITRACLILQPQDYYERGNGNFPAALSMDGKHVGKIHVARIKPYIVSR